MTPQIVGRYHIVAELGGGGSSNVYLAVARGPANFTRLLVLKRLRERLAFEPAFVVMLLDEARIAARLSHPNIVQMVEMIEVAGEFYIVMEYLEGQTFRNLSARAPVPEQISLTILCDVLEGMHYAHELKDFDGGALAIVHRDLKPSNVFVTYDGLTKIVDFGLARAIGRSTHTAQGVLKGSPAYMAPEQARQRDLDRRADIFAIGVMAWEAATGTRMWGGLKRVDVLTRLLRRELPPPPSEVRPDVSQELDAIVRRATAVEPNDRYATAAEFQKALGHYLGTIGGRATPRQVADHIGTAFATERESIRRKLDEQLARFRRDPSSVSAFGGPNLSLGHTPSPSDTSSGGSSSLPDADAATQVRGPLQRAPERTKVMANSPGRVAAVEAPPSENPSPTDPARPRVQRPLGARSALVALLVALGVVVLVVLRPGTRKAAIAPSPAPSGSPESGVSAKRVEVRLRAAPEEAVFFIDDGGALPNPYEGTLPQTDDAHVLRIVAPNHREMSHTFVAKEDIALRFNLADERRTDAGKAR